MDRCEAGFRSGVVETVVGIWMQFAVLCRSGVWKYGRGKDFTMEINRRDVLHAACHGERIVAVMLREQRLPGGRGSEIDHRSLYRAVDFDACELLDECGIYAAAHVECTTVGNEFLNVIDGVLWQVVSVC